MRSPTPQLRFVSLRPPAGCSAAPPGPWLGIVGLARPERKGLRLDRLRQPRTNPYPRSAAIRTAGSWPRPPAATPRSKPGLPGRRPADYPISGRRRATENDPCDSNRYIEGEHGPGAARRQCGDPDRPDRRAVSPGQTRQSTTSSAGTRALNSFFTASAKTSFGAAAAPAQHSFGIVPVWQSAQTFSVGMMETLAAAAALSFITARDWPPPAPATRSWMPWRSAAVLPAAIALPLPVTWHARQGRRSSDSRRASRTRFSGPTPSRSRRLALRLAHVTGLAGNCADVLGGGGLLLGGGFLGLLRRARVGTTMPATTTPPAQP